MTWSGLVLLVVAVAATLLAAGWLAGWLVRRLRGEWACGAGVDSDYSRTICCLNSDSAVLCIIDSITVATSEPSATEEEEEEREQSRRRRVPPVECALCAVSCGCECL